MKKIGIICCLVILGMPLFAQTNTSATLQMATDEAVNSPVPFANTIDAAGMEKHLTILASDEFEGRETGELGQQKAAEYIAEHFKKLGIPPSANGSYFQEIVYTSENWKDAKLTVAGNEYKNMRQFYAFPGTNASMESLNIKDVVFLGYGIDDKKYSDYKGNDVRGKVIMIYKNEPVKRNGKSRLTKTKELSDWSTDFRKKLAVAHENGVKAVLIIDDKIQKSISENRRFLVGSRMRLGRGEEPENKYANNVFISSEIAKAIIGEQMSTVIAARKKARKKRKLEPVNLTTDMTLTLEKETRQLIGSNVMGFIEGTDKKDEIVVITAHYDHLGKRGNSIYNGADDNGSGSSTVLEIAEAFVEAKNAGKGPRRSVLCMLVSGEEKGLLGSKYYVENPIYPLANTIVDINVDMVGRVDEAHADNPEYVYVIGADRLSSELHEINEHANKTYTNIELDYTFNEESDPNRYYYRSDHYNFAEKNIPAVFYFSGVHSDYHRPSDTVDKIMFDKMEKIGHLVFYTAWELANREKRIEVDKK